MMMSPLDSMLCLIGIQRLLCTSNTEHGIANELHFSYRRHTFLGKGFPKLKYDFGHVAETTPNTTHGIFIASSVTSSDKW